MGRGRGNTEGLFLIDQIRNLKFGNFKKTERTDLGHKFKKLAEGTSVVAQWLRTRLPMQGTRVQALVPEDPTCCGATKPVRHNY